MFSQLYFYLAILQRRGWIIIICLVLSVFMSFLSYTRQSLIYEAQSRYQVGAVIQNPVMTSRFIGLNNLAGQGYAAIATSRPFLESILSSLKLDDDIKIIANNVS